MPQIASFVFFDIETTGLPFQESNQTKIIELCLLAAVRDDILTTPFGSTPPVSKLTFLVHPQRPIHPEATRLTGLTNKLLIHAPLLKQKIGSMISFLHGLPKPVCLVAHNGNLFDYKILLAEMNDAQASLPQDLLCVDSLVGFRKLLQGTNISHLTLSMLPTSTSTNEDLLVTEDEDDWPDLNLSSEQWQEIDQLTVSSPDTKTKKLKIKKAKKKVVENVFNKKSASTKKGKGSKWDKPCYKLAALYKRLLNKEEMNMHRAEADCLMLAQCVVALKEEFLRWADGACTLLSNIQPLVR